MSREATDPPAAVNVLDVSSESMAAFQVFLYGRFWVFTEAASHKDIGAGKWQAGVAGIVSTKSSFGLIAAVITYQHSFSGYGSDRPEVNLVTVQPLVFGFRRQSVDSGKRHCD
jgi:hypothetical protein